MKIETCVTNLFQVVVKRAPKIRNSLKALSSLCMTKTFNDVSIKIIGKS